MEVLVQNQSGGGGVAGEYRFPDWARVMWDRGVVGERQAVIQIRTDQLRGHEELEDVIMMAMATTEPHHHVVAVVGEEYLDACGERTGVRFRVFDNDAAARQRGEGRLVSTRVLADTRCCTMYALVEHGSALQVRAEANTRAPPAARQRREMAEQVVEGAIEQALWM